MTQKKHGLDTLALAVKFSRRPATSGRVLQSLSPNRWKTGRRPVASYYWEQISWCIGTPIRVQFEGHANVYTQIHHRLVYEFLAPKYPLKTGVPSTLWQSGRQCFPKLFAAQNLTCVLGVQLQQFREFDTAKNLPVDL